MKTGKERKPAGNIHRQQLFYWMGRGIDDRNGRRKVLSDALVREVLAQVRGSLERGLWVKSPRVPEKLELRGSSFALDLPIACLTEWSLGESLSHTTEYGRIGLGFPKRWVIERGGQSVTGTSNNPIFHVAELVWSMGCSGKLFSGRVHTDKSSAEAPFLSVASLWLRLTRASASCGPITAAA